MVQGYTNQLTGREMDVHEGVESIDTAVGDVQDASGAAQGLLLLVERCQLLC